MNTALTEALEKRAAPGPVVWRTFVRGLAVELATQVAPEVTMAILRGIGHRMAGQLTLLAVDSLEALELEMNVVLAEIGWGSVQLMLQETERCVLLIHTDLPRIGSAGDPPGTWLAPVLIGLYHGWMGQQPGADGSFVASIRRQDGDQVVIRYGR